MGNFQTPPFDYSGMSDDEIYYIAETFERELSELLEKYKIHYQSWFFFKLLDQGHKSFKEQLLLEQRRVE